MAGVDKSRATVINASLWQKEIHNRATFRAIEGWLGLGNAFAHNGPEQITSTARDIAKAPADVRSFLGVLLV